MSLQRGIKFQSYVEFWEFLPPDQREIVDVLRPLILENLPSSTKEKLSYNVPFYYGRRRICLIWPGAIPWGGIREGVLLGFCQGYKLRDPENYLTHGTNKQVFYKIYKSVDEIEFAPIVSLLKEAVVVDQQVKRKK